MVKKGGLSCKGLADLQKKLSGVEGAYDLFLESCAKELAARLLRKVIKRTPVGDYTVEVEKVAKRDSKNHKKGETYTEKEADGSGRTGGTLKRGWTGGEKSSASAYAQSLPIHHQGSMYTIEVKNPIEYASYVEYGHRQEVGKYVPALGKQLKQGWVSGKFMLTTSEDELKSIAPAVLESKIKKKLKEVFG